MKEVGSLFQYFTTLTEKDLGLGSTDYKNIYWKLWAIANGASEWVCKLLCFKKLQIHQRVELQIAHKPLLYSYAMLKLSWFYEYHGTMTKGFIYRIRME